MKLILITLVAVVVGMMVACSSEPAAPAAPAATPAPSHPQISEDEAIALVKQHLRLMPMGKAYNCLGFLTKDDRYRESSPATAVERDRGSWEVTWKIDWDGPIATFKWMVYPTTKAVNRIDNSSYRIGSCP